MAGDINALRARGCEGSSASLTKLRTNRQLEGVAREWSKGGRLHAALERTKFRAVNSASVHIQGSRDDSKIVEAVRFAHCASITNPQFTDIGVYRRGDNTWIVVALPFSPPTIAEAPAIGQQVLALVNQARANPRRCGDKAFPAAKPVTLSATLSRAALIHAQDMASHDLFEHIGSDGSTPGKRASRVGYSWGVVGENIAAGAATAEEVVSGWLASPTHCVNVMGAKFTQMGIAYVVDPNSEAGIYWAQEFARPR